MGAGEGVGVCVGLAGDVGVGAGVSVAVDVGVGVSVGGDVGSVVGVAVEVVVAVGRRWRRWTVMTSMAKSHLTGTVQPSKSRRRRKAS